MSTETLETIGAETAYRQKERAMEMKLQETLIMYLN